MSKYDILIQHRSRLVLFQMSKYDEIWANMITYEQTWSDRNKYDILFQHRRLVCAVPDEQKSKQEILCRVYGNAFSKGKNFHFVRVILSCLKIGLKNLIFFNLYPGLQNSKLVLESSKKFWKCSDSAQCFVWWTKIIQRPLWKWICRHTKGDFLSKTNIYHSSFSVSLIILLYKENVYTIFFLFVPISPLSFPKLTIWWTFCTVFCPA